MMPNDILKIINELSFANFILFGDRESEYIADISSGFMFPLLLSFHATPKVRETLPEGFFTYSACCFRQGGL